jgi:acetaldehyde dehydrogenase / alcohol dehydrogenase
MGLMEDKVIKNHFASEYIYNKYKHEKTCGVIEYSAETGMAKVAEPMGVIAGIIPTTNPTSTAIFKCLIALKTRNSIIIAPHPRAPNCTGAAARAVYEGAIAAGAPEDIVQWIEKPEMAVSMALMKHPDVSLILATGGPGMVKSAMSSAHPAIGVGAGNTPVVIDETADILSAVSSIILSKTFDNGVICASEQSIIVLDSVYDKVKAELIARGGYLLEGAEKEAVRSKIVVDGHINADIVGQSVENLGKIFGFAVPPGTRLLFGEIDSIGAHEPLSTEKLSPILGFYRAKNFDEATKLAVDLITFGGPGHTSVLYTSPLNRKNITHFQKYMNTVRILINTPASQGAIGDLYNFHLDPSLTLGCGTWGGTSLSSNVAPKHLLNVKTVSERRENMLWFRVPPKIYFKPGCLEVAMQEFAHKKRVFVVTDKPLYDMGVSRKVTDLLDAMRVQHTTYYHVQPDPTLEIIYEGLKEVLSFQPDVIIAIGGGSPMDAAKVMWLLYEHPEVTFEGLSARFMDIRKRVYEVPTLGTKAQLVCIPTSSGTGSEVTPFSVVTDEKTGNKYPLADYALTPSMAIIDANFCMAMPKGLVAYGGIDALTHALESYVSVLATDYTRGLSREAIGLIFDFLPRSYADGANDAEARERVHNASTVAGMAFANAFLGICHSIAHKLGAAFHIPHGLANAALITHVIAYNATDVPFKQAIFPQYKYPQAKRRYAEVAQHLGMAGASDDESVLKLIAGIEALKRSVGIPGSLAEIMGPEKKELFFARIEDIANQAFDDQCTGANPRYPLIKDLSQILSDAWHGPPTKLW